MFSRRRKEGRAAMLLPGRARAVVAAVTVEPAMFAYFLSIYLLYSVFHPTVFGRVCSAHLATHPSLNTSHCSRLYSINSTEATAALAEVKTLF